MLNPVWLRSFIEVAHRSGMASASRALKITTAAVSKHVSSLENALGVALFKRSTSFMELTPEGLLYLEYAKSILEAYRNADAAISQTKKEPEGVLKIICGPHIGNLYLIPHLKTFLDRYPKVRLHIEFTQTVPNLEKEKVDIVLGLSSGIPPQWIQRTITHARWLFCASPEYLKDNGIPKKPAELIRHRIITRSQRNPNNIIEFKTGESILFEPYLFFNDTREIRQAVLQGIGIAQLHNYIVEDDLRENRLVEILQKHTEQKNTIPIHISYLPSSNLHIKTRKFVDFMVEIMRL